MGLWILRFIFLLVALGLGVSLLTPELELIRGDAPWYYWWGAIFGCVVLAIIAIVVDASIRHKELKVISSVYFGLIVGLLLAYVVGIAFQPLLAYVVRVVYEPNTADEIVKMEGSVRQAFNTIMAALICYVCISLLMQTRDDFRFIIPYIEFAKDVKGNRPYVLDTSVVIDGRIADVIEAKIFLDSQLIMPEFVIAELHSIADSSDRQKRSQGRRGLDILKRLRNNPEVDLKILDKDPPELAAQPPDMKLILLAKFSNARLITNDYSLNKIAEVQGVGVVNLNDLANAMKPVFLPGDHISLRIARPGEEAGQGVGYLDDGTMVVVEGGRIHLNKDVSVSVTSVLQTSAGRMVFGKVEGLTNNHVSPESPRDGKAS